MHLKTRKVVLLGVLTAVSVLLVCLGNVIESSTFFLIAVASFCTGVAVYEAGIVLGSGFVVASSALAFLLSGNKFYCFTFTAMCIYILFIEKSKKNYKKCYCVCFLFFNIIYIPVVLLVPELLLAVKPSTKIIVIMLVAGQGVLFLYHYAYSVFIVKIWPQIKKRYRL